MWFASCLLISKDWRRVTHTANARKLPRPVTSLTTSPFTITARIRFAACKVMPSGGAMMHSLSLLRADLRAGFVGMSLRPAAALALSLLADPAGRRWVTWARRAALVVAVALLLYGVATLVQHALMVTGLVDPPAGLGETAVRWHLALWDPYWLVGGTRLLPAVRRTGRR